MLVDIGQCIGKKDQENDTVILGDINVNCCDTDEVI